MEAVKKWYRVKKGHKCFFVGRVSSFLVNSPPTRPISCPIIFTILPQNQNVKFHFACIYLFHYYFSVSTSSDFYDIFQVSSSFFFLKKKNVNALAIRPSEMKGLGLTSVGIWWKSNQMHCNNQSTTLFISLIEACSFLTNKDRAFYCSLKYSAKLNAMVLLLKAPANRDYR